MLEYSLLLIRLIFHMVWNCLTGLDQIEPIMSRMRGCKGAMHSAVWGAVLNKLTRCWCCDCGCGCGRRFHRSSASFGMILYKRQVEQLRRCSHEWVAYSCGKCIEWCLRVFLWLSDIFKIRHEKLSAFCDNTVPCSTKYIVINLDFVDLVVGLCRYFEPEDVLVGKHTYIIIPQALPVSNLDSSDSASKAATTFYLNSIILLSNSVYQCIISKILGMLQW